ncbi:MAG: DUF5343 domain-containing protein [Candidatus Poribacteria bacterium]|nr:DUF5343 domain-containing protein [Candidatus Poribacteria bacterium]
MAALPYVTAPGNVPKALNAIISAATPDKVTQDFVKEMLKIPGGSGDQMTSFLKKIGMAGPDGTPTDTYKKFRNEATRGTAAASVLRYGYSRLYKRNEYMHTLSPAKLKGLIIEETGADEKNSSVRNTAKCIQGIKAFASFDADSEETAEAQQEISPPVLPDERTARQFQQLPMKEQGVGMNLSYTINLNLPATSDIAVFNAIFKSLKENLLSASDG